MKPKTMTPTPPDIQLNTIYNEDCLETMKRMPDNYLHAIVTDPPYGLSFMGKAWDYDVPKVEIWREALRVLKPGGHLLAFAGSRTYHRMAVAIEDAGFEIRDQLIWMYGSGFPKSLNIGKSVEAFVKTGNASKNGFHKLDGERRDGRIGMYDTVEEQGFRAKNPDQLGAYDLDPTTDEAKHWNGYGTALKPAHEPCVLARKPIEGTVANNVLKHGTGGLNIDGTRVNIPGGWEQERGATWLKSGHGKADNELQSMSGKERNGVYVSNLGRFPANLIHDGSDEVEAVFPQTGKGAFPLKSNVPTGKHYEGGWKAVDNGVRTEMDNGGSASRYFYTAKASKRERGQGNNHPTVKPIALMKYLVKLVAPPKNGIIYDPFSGSGTTLLACQKLGIEFIGSELSQEYCDIAEKRLKQEVLL